MKLKLVAVAVTSLLAAGVVNAAEVYNKDGNKLDLTEVMVTKLTRVWALKAKRRSTIS